MYCCKKEELEKWFKYFESTNSFTEADIKNFEPDSIKRDTVIKDFLSYKVIVKKLDYDEQGNESISYAVTAARKDNFNKFTANLKRNHQL